MTAINIIANGSWDGDAAKKRLIEWARDESGKISKRKLLPYFGRIDGDGQNISDYHYPWGDVKDGKAAFDQDGLKVAFTFASGAMTGSSDAKLKSRISKLMKKHFGEKAMTEKMKLNSVSSSGILRETDEYIDVNAVFMKEGVFTGTDNIPTKKVYEYFAPHAHWLLGQPILKGHIDRPVNYTDKRVGQIIEAAPRPETRDVAGVVRYFKNELGDDDIERIRSDNPYDGSICYTANSISEEGSFNGDQYKAVEGSEGYHFYHFAEVDHGACSQEHGCGFKKNKCGKRKELQMPEIIEEAGTAAVVVAKPEPIEVKLNSEAIDAVVATFTAKVTEIENKLNSIGDVAALTKSVSELSEKVDTLMADRENIMKTNAASLEARNKESFGMRLNAKARAEIDTHYAGFVKEGWPYLDAHPEIMAIPVMKQNAVGDGVTPGTSAIESVREKLRKTLAREE